jgi:ATP-dependent Clp protease ATP-binding subunit ClpC
MVGREAEMRLLIEGLCRPSKPNVLLVGEAGVGKSALVEGLAARMAGGEVPSVLRDRPLVALSMAQVTRESRYYGVMEQRLSALLVEACAVRAILFLDEGHAMTGSGGREGTGDVASVLKPALARGDLSLISATTEQEYQRFIVPNAALERRFTVVHLAEPGREAVRAMLAAHRDAIAKTCRVGVDDAALDRLLEVTTVRASHRREPDRSRDLLDQAVARAIAVGGSMVTSADIEATAAAVSGAPEVTDASLAALERALVGRGLLSVTDAANVIDRLGTTYAGLVLRPQRPRATVLVLRSGVVDGLAVAETLAGGVFGGPERVIAINVGAIGEPGAISGFLGTPQGFIGHGSHLPIHGLAERPHSVLLLGGVDASHEQLRSLLARAILDGFLTDAGARRIGLSSAVVVLEATLPRRGGRRLGFRTGDSLAATGQTAPGPGTDHGSFAVAAVGRELAAECDLVVIPCDDAVDGRGWVAQLLGRLATSYRSAGVHLAWEPEVEALLAADLPAVAAREREAAVESRLGRAIRPLLRARPGPWRVRIRHGASGLVAEAEA